MVAVGRDPGERLRHERAQQAVLARDGGADLAVGGDVVGGADRAVEAEVELELAGGVLVVAVAHVEAHPLAVVDHVEQHRTQLLELVDVVAVGLGDALGGAVLAPAHPHHLGLDPDHEVEPELGLELAHHPLQVLARVGVEQLARLGVVAVAVDPGDALVPREDRERVEVGDRRQLGLLRPEADVVAVAVGEQVGGRAVDELVAPLGDLREERGDDALAHHPARSSRPAGRRRIGCPRRRSASSAPRSAPARPACLRASSRVAGGISTRGASSTVSIVPPSLLSGHCRGSFRR